MADTKMSLKLLIDKKAKKVLFAEAGKEFVDFLFNLLSVPVSSVMRLLKNPGTVGCIGNLYQSLENLNGVYMPPNQDEHSLLNPYVPTIDNDVSLLLPHTSQKPPKTWLYRCRNNHGVVTDRASTPCLSCESPMINEVEYMSYQTANAQSISEVSYMVTYMVMDDLSVTPMSMVSGSFLLNKCSVTDIGALEERLVDVGIEEGVDLLKAYLRSEGALTEVFIVKKESNDVSNPT